MATFKHLPTDSLTRPGLALVKGGYRFSYDKCNRLTDAEYSENDSHEECQNYYDEPIQKYDANGNIEHLQRRGRKQDGHVGKIDNLSIFHHGNQLSSVVDDAAKIYYAGIFNFNGDGKNEAHYKYNDSGSLIEDTGRGITNIEYDDWNNPKRIQFANGNVTKYVYSADGQKLRTVHYTAAPNITVAAGQTHELSKDEILSIDSTDYIGRLVLKNGKPDMYLFAGGYYKYQSSDDATASSGNSIGGLYFYNYDHLGNVREVVNEDGKLLQVNNYYPFGAPYSDNRITSMNPKLQPYKYTGKELDLVHGLNTYDHGARQNYSALGVWDRVDPLVEKYYNLSPYAVCENNPVILIDHTGRDVFDTNGIFLSDADNSNNIYIEDENKNKRLLSSFNYGPNNDKNIKMLENVATYYLKKSDPNEFKVNVEETGNGIPQAAAFAYSIPEDSYYVELTNNRINNYLDDKYNFMNIAYHESRHRYYTETRGGTIGEVNAILMQSSQESWYLATDDYIRSMASYAEVSLQKSLNLSLSKQQIVDYINRLNVAFNGKANFNYKDGNIDMTLSLDEFIVTPKK